MQFFQIATLAVFMSLMGAQHAAVKHSPAQSSPWKSIDTKMGVQLSVTAASKIPAIKIAISKRPTVEDVAIAGWGGIPLHIERQAISKDEDASDTEATKIEDVIFKDANLDEARISKIGYLTISGWPAIDLEGVSDDGTMFRYRVCRTNAVIRKG